MTPSVSSSRQWFQQRPVAALTLVLLAFFSVSSALAGDGSTTTEHLQPTTCSGFEGADRATKLNLPRSASAEQFTSKVAARFEYQPSILGQFGHVSADPSLACSGFTLSKKFTDRSIQGVRLVASLAALASTESTDVLVPGYSLDDGQTWQTLETVSMRGEVSNATHEGYWDFALPPGITADDLPHLRVQLQYRSGGGFSSASVAVDGLMLDVDLSVPEKRGLLGGILSTVEQPLIILDQGSVDSLELLDADGHVVSTPLVTEVVAGQLYVGVQSGAILSPGTYVVRTKTKQLFRTVTQEHAFAYGVANLNVTRSTYRVGDPVTVAMSAVDRRGRTVCDASLALRIEKPSGTVAVLTTSDSSIVRSPDCGPANITDRPDYRADFQATEVGDYHLALSLATDSGTQTITQEVHVTVDPAFTVERIAPVRINPHLPYVQRVRVTTPDAYDGSVDEVVPSGVVISELPETASIEQRASDQVIHFAVRAQAGETVELRYVFDAPDVAPALYQFGPVTAGSWQEGRVWTVTADEVVRKERADVAYQPLPITNDDFVVARPTLVETTKSVFAANEDAQLKVYRHGYELPARSRPAKFAPTSPLEVTKVTVESKNTSQALSAVRVSEDFQHGDQELEVLHLVPTRDFRPGAYVVTATYSDGQRSVTQQSEFLWGVLAINPTVAVPSPGEEVTLSIGIVNDVGQTVCNAGVQLTVTSPDGDSRAFSTTDGTVERSAACAERSVTNTPDYSASYRVGGSGNYQLTATATTDRGSFTLTETLTVRDDALLHLERLAPVRVYPLAEYDVTLRAVPRQDVRATFTELVPSAYRIISANSEGRGERVNDETTAITWDVDWQAGQTYELTYRVDPADVSPALFRFGPASTQGFTEGREWQIASDSTDNFIAFWVGAGDTPNASWTCLSCGSGDFYQKFPRGAATYGGTGGAATHSDHAISWVSVAAQTTSPLTATAGAVTEATKTHTHGSISSASMGSGTLLPVYQNIKVIRYDTPGTPASIPAGVVLMFDAAPSGSWSRYTDQDGDFLYGAADISGVGGEATHTHGSVAYTVGASSGSLALTLGDSLGFGSFDAHTHTVSGETTASEDHTPPYLDVLLYQATEATTLPDGAIAMWDDTPSDAAWTVNSGASQTFNGKLLRGSSSYTGTPLGSATHNHTNLGSTTSGASGGTNYAGLGTARGANVSHTHTATVSFGTSNNLPPYIDVIMAKYTAPAGVDISGQIYTNEGSTPLDCGTSRTVNLRVNGTGTDTVECSNTPANGSFAFTGLTIASGDVVTLYLDNETEKATTVFISDGTNQTNLALYQNVVIARADTSTMTNANLATGDDGDVDVLYSVATNNLTVDSNIELHIWTGDGYAPAGTVTTQGTGSLHLDDNATATLDTATNAIANDAVVDAGATLTVNASITVAGGDITTSGTGAVATSSGTPTVTMRGTGSIGGGSGGITLYNLAIGDGTTASTTLSSAVTTTTDVAVAAGSTLTVNADLTVNGGDLSTTTTGVIAHSSGTPTVTVAGTGTIGGGAGAVTFYNLTLSGTPTLGTSMTVKNNLTLPASVTAGSTTVTMSGTSGTLVGGGATLNDLTIDPASTGTVTLSTSDLTVSGTLNVASGDTLSLASGRTLTHSGATLTLTGTISGAGRLTYMSATNFPTTGTISSILRYDMTATAQNVTNRTYGGLVEIYANTASTRSATALTGTTVMTGGLTLSTGNAAVTFDQTSADPTLTVTGTVTIGAGTTFSASNSATTSFADSFANSGTFTANSGTITFTATDAGNTLSGTLNGSSAFYNVTFNGTGGAWTIQDPMLISAANETDTLVLRAGTVTIGDGNGDNFEVDGKVVVAGTAGDTATLQTTALAEGSSLTFDMNANTSTPSCTNCFVSVGAASGAGTGTFKVQKNTILRLNPRSAATASNTGVQVFSTGNLQIVGSLDDSGTSDSTTNETTLTDTTKAWTTDAHAGKKLRISNTSSLAYGRVYPITANTATALTYTTTASASSTIASITNTGANPVRKICAAAATMVTANDEGIGRYLHDTTGTAGYFQIVDSVNNDATCSSNDAFYIVAIPTAFTALATSDAIQVSDGLQQGDQYELLDYAYVTAENGTACNAAVNEAGEAYIYGNAASQLTIQYADVCNLGRNAGGYRGLEATGIDGSVAGAGILVDRSELHGNAWNYFGTSPNNNSTYGYGIYRNLIYSNATYAMHPGGSGMEINGNRIYSNTGNGIFGSNTASLTITNNHVYLNSSDGIELEAAGVSISGNTVYKNTGYGIYFVGADNSASTSNAIFSNTSAGVYDSGAAYNNTHTSNSIYYNDSFGLRINNTANTVVTSNAIYANKSYGFYTSNTVKNVVARSNTIYYNTLIDVILGKTTYSILTDNVIYNIGSPTTTYGIYFSGTGPTPDSNVLVGNSVYSERYGMSTADSAATTKNVFINEQYGVTSSNWTADIVSSAYADQYSFYNSRLASTETSGALTPTNAFFISRKHDGVAGAAKVWGEYAVQADNAETPQNEATDQFNYANNLWPDSFTPHGYSAGYGAGTEDTDLDYAVDGTFGGDASAYAYRIVCTAANCVTTGSAWDVYRNGTLLTAKASTGSTYTDTQVDGSTAPNVQFKIDDIDVDYTAGATYTFVAWKASGDTSTQKTITMAQDGDKFTVGSGKALELKGQSAGTNVTQVTRGTTGGYQFAVDGTIDANAYSFNYLGGAAQASGLDINSGATVTSLDNGSFDNFGTNVGAADSFIDIDSSLIGSGTPTVIVDGTSFANTGSNANCAVNVTGVDAAGYWQFTGATGAFGTESNDCNDGAADADPGQVKWGGVKITGTVYSDDGATPYNCSGNNLTINASANGGANGAATCTAAGGTFTVASGTSPASVADPLVLSIDSAETPKATTATLVASTTAALSGMNLYQDRLILRHENAGPMTNAKLATGDNADAGIRYAVSSSNLTVESGIELHVWTGDSYSPGGTVTTQGAGDLHVDDSATATFDGAAVTVDGDLAVDSAATLSAPSASDLTLNGNYANSGTFTANGGTVTIAGSAQQTLSGTMTGGSAFGTLVVTNSSGIDPDTSPSVIFANDATATAFTATSASTKLRFAASGTYTFTTFTTNGQATGTRVTLRSSSGGSQWTLTTTTESVSNTDVKDSSATNEIFADDGTNLDSEGNNANWIFVRTLTAALDANTAALGTLAASTINKAAIVSTVTTNATNGYSSTVLYTAPLRIDVSNDIDDTAGGTIVAGTEEFGVASSDTSVDIATWSPAACATNSSTSNATALTTSAQSFATAAAPVSAEATTLCFLASITPLTAAGSYATTVTITTTAKF